MESQQHLTSKEPREVSPKGQNNVVQILQNLETTKYKYNGYIWYFSFLSFLLFSLPTNPSCAFRLRQSDVFHNNTAWFEFILFTSYLSA